MSEPLNSLGGPVDGEPSSGSDFSGEIAEAADALERQLPPAGGETEGGAPAAEKSPQPGAAKPPRAEKYQALQRGARGRFQRERRELERRRAQEADLNRRLEAQNEILKNTLEALRQARGGAAEPEEIPDPAVDPAGYQKWITAKIEGTTGAALKPLLDDLQFRRDEISRLTAEREQHEGLEQQRGELISQFEDWHYQYEQESPELAAGAADRVVAFREVMGDVFKGAGAPPQLFDQWLFALSRYAEAGGDNPVAFIDAVLCGIAERFGLEPDTGGGNGSGNGNGHSPTVRAPSEPARVAAVRARAGSVASAAPRQAARAAQHQSEARDLLEGGVTDLGQIKAAALRDAGGNPALAAKLLATLLQQPGA
jgi:hypothetical protein